MPSSDEEEPIGYLLVGPRPDGSIPSTEEQKALDGVSEAIARAIRTVIKREAREAEVAELIAEMRAASRSSKDARRGPRWQANGPAARPDRLKFVRRSLTLFKSKDNSVAEATRG